LPAAEARLARIKELDLAPDYTSLENGVHPYPKDKALAEVMRRAEGPILAGALANDPEHATDNPQID
jgi:hypothetical protein